MGFIIGTEVSLNALRTLVWWLLTSVRNQMQLQTNYFLAMIIYRVNTNILIYSIARSLGFLTKRNGRIRTISAHVKYV